MGFLRYLLDCGFGNYRPLHLTLRWQRPAEAARNRAIARRSGCYRFPRASTSATPDGPSGEETMKPFPRKEHLQSTPRSTGGEDPGAIPVAGSARDAWALAPQPSAAEKPRFRVGTLYECPLPFFVELADE